MKKLIIVILGTLFLIAYATAIHTDYPQPTSKSIEQKVSRYAAQTSTRSVPNVEFAVEPIVFAEQYYDYMHGGYNSLALRKQPGISEPGGFPANKLYFPFMYQETAASERRIYYVYIDEDGYISTPSPVSSSNINEGFASIDIDPVTANPLVAWHSDVDDETEYEVMLSYDLYNVIGDVGLWSAPQLLLDNPLPDFPDYNEFIWPIIQIGPSPEDGKRRAHLYANYNTPSTDIPAYYNMAYGYCDFQYEPAIFDFVWDEWHFTTFPIFDALQDNQEKRAIKDMIVSEVDGKVAFIGHLSDSLFCFISSDYGENFEYHAQNATYDIFDYPNEDGTPYFVSEDGDPEDAMICPNGDGSHYNAEFVDGESRIIFMSAMGINTYESHAENMYIPFHFNPKIFIYDIETASFDFVDMQLIGVDAYDDQPMISCDLDEDGLVDQYASDGTPLFADCWPTYYCDDDLKNGSFHESFGRVISNDNHVVAIWMEGSKAMNAFYEVDGYDDWSEVAEIMIAVSSDYGETWSDPRIMNAKQDDENYYSELQGMKPCYIYPADEMEMIDDTHAKLPITFFDDNSFGSYVSSVNAGLPNGGSNCYAVLEIEFIAQGGSNGGNSEIAPQAINLQQNYPNPFNPSTSIAYSLKNNGEVNLEVYNMKGQLVKSLVNEFQETGDYNIRWNGDNETGKSVASGIYFYKLRTGKSSSAKKMILMK